MHEDPTVSLPLIEMLTVANEYCLFMEQAQSRSKEELLDFFRKIAPMLYLKASLLPPLTPEDETQATRHVTEEEWEGIFKTLREQFGPEDVYHTHDHNHDSVEASLADNMADIYQEMKDFLMLYQKNTSAARENALASLSGTFAWRWGPALLSALHRVHQILFIEDISPDIINIQ